MKKITITWMDGQEKTYTCKSVEVEDGRLKIWQPSPSPEPYRAVPLCNVREYTIAEA